MVLCLIWRRVPWMRRSLHIAGFICNATSTRVFPPGLSRPHESFEQNVSIHTGQLETLGKVRQAR